MADSNESTQRFPDDLVTGNQDGLDAQEIAAISALPSGSALLVVKRGAADGARFLLDTDLATAGRHPNADIFLDDVTVSRKHAEFSRKGRFFEVRDQASLNGTYVNGKSIDSVMLNNGDEVQIGKFKLTFYASPADLS
jgi:pSer/pThr/pTyr-binding forkhead associated (FHA) protein